MDFTALKEVHKGSKDTLIIHIQDAHSNLSGQESLASALDEIMAKYHVSLVLSEGGSKDCSLTPIKDMAPPAVWKKIARSYLVQGKLQGEEYLNLVSDHPMKIMGLEDLPLYLKSVQSYAELARQRNGILDYLSVVRQRVDKLKQKVYPSELLAYEKAGTGADESKFKALFKIAKERNVDITEFRYLTGLLELILKEQLIDFDLADLEQASLLEEIEKRGGPGVKEELLKMGQLKNQRLSQFAYFTKTFKIAREKGIALDKYPDLLRYVEYLKNFSDLDLDAIMEELEKAENKVYGSLLAGKDALLIRAIDRYLGLLDLAYRIRMSTKDFEAFKANEPDFSTASYLAFLNRKLAEHGFFEDLVPYQAVLEEGKRSLESFYDSVEKRDHAFLRNTERILKEEGQRAAILISGGYHTPHLKRLLEDKGYSIVVLTPVVTGETDQNKYEKRLLAPLQPKVRTIETVYGESKNDRSLGALEKDLQKLVKPKDGVRTALLGMVNEAGILETLTDPDADTLKDVQQLLGYDEIQFKQLLPWPRAPRAR